MSEKTDDGMYEVPGSRLRNLRDAEARLSRIDQLDAEVVARWFHEAYERFAPGFGYKTREDSAVPWEDVPVQNRSLMVSTAAEVLKRIRL